MNSWKIPAIIVLSLCVIGAAYFYTSGRSNPISGPDKAAADDRTGEIIPMYYSIEDDIAPALEKCPEAKDVDWNLAVIILSDYMQYGAGIGTDYGPANIQRHFAENCKQDMVIYTETIQKNPHLLRQ